MIYVKNIRTVHSYKLVCIQYFFKVRHGFIFQEMALHCMKFNIVIGRFKENNFMNGYNPDFTTQSDNFSTTQYSLGYSRDTTGKTPNFLGKNFRLCVSF